MKTTGDTYKVLQKTVAQIHTQQETSHDGLNLNRISELLRFLNSLSHLVRALPDSKPDFAEATRLINVSVDHLLTVSCSSPRKICA